MFINNQILGGYIHYLLTPDSKVHGANMGPIWGRQDPGGPHVGPVNCAICDNFSLWKGRYLHSLSIVQMVPIYCIRNVYAYVLKVGWLLPQPFMMCPYRN